MDNESTEASPGAAPGGAQERPRGTESWSIHPIDIRLSLPFARTRYYITVVAGRERRRTERRQSDRPAYPLLTFGNVLFSLGVITLITLAALAVLIFRSAIIE